MKIILTGGTGLIGSEIIRQSAHDPPISELVSLSRSTPAVQHSRLRTRIHQDFMDYKGLENEFQNTNALIWALGISQTQVSKKQYEIITHGYLSACVEFCKKINPGIRFVFVSGDGADRSEKSRVLYKRIKGRAENTLLNSGLNAAYIARPDAVRPRHRHSKEPLAYKLIYPLFPLVELLAPHKVIWSDILAKALLSIAMNGYEKQTIKNQELRVVGTRNAPGR
jgi:uncharacterized protein YbjT (DUF2867 family)